MGREITYMGGAGCGQLTKMLNNVLFNVSCAAMAEMLPVATSLGIEPERFCSGMFTKVRVDILNEIVCQEWRNRVLNHYSLPFDMFF